MRWAAPRSTAPAAARVSSRRPYPIVLTSIQRRLDRLRIEEFADLSSRNSPELLFDLMGYGRDPASFDPGRWAHGAHSFGPSLRLVGEALGLPLESIESTGEVAVATRDVQIAAGTVPAGTVAAQRMTVSGLRHGEVSCPSAPPGTARRRSTPTGICAGRLAGGRRRRLPLGRRDPAGHPARAHGGDTPGYTAHRAVNAVPVVCEAPPGIRTIGRASPGDRQPGYGGLGD